MQPPLRASDSDRERAVGVLTRGYVEGRISTETFERRVWDVQRARSRAALRELLADLSRRRRAAETLLGTLLPRHAQPELWVTVLLARCATGRPVVIGRGRDCEIQLPSDAVSRRHARLDWTAEGWFVTDLGSTNGTCVEDVAVERAPVRRGTRLRLGDAYVDLA